MTDNCIACGHPIKEHPEVRCKCGEVSRLNPARTRQTNTLCTKCHASHFYRDKKPVGIFDGVEKPLQFVEDDKPRLFEDEK